MTWCVCVSRLLAFKSHGSVQSETRTCDLSAVWLYAKRDEQVFDDFETTHTPARRYTLVTGSALNDGRARTSGSVSSLVGVDRSAAIWSL